MPILFQVTRTTDLAEARISAPTEKKLPLGMREISRQIRIMGKQANKLNNNKLKEETKRKKIGYAVTLLPVTPLRVLLTTRGA